MERLVVVIMGQNCRKFIKMAYESVKDADAIMFCDGGSNDGTIDYLKSKGFVWEPITDKEFNKTMIFQHYDQVEKKMNGRQRNFYLECAKKKYPGWWCLVIDADEVVEDLGKIKEFINYIPKEHHDILFSPKMRHFIGDLGHEDSTVPVHFVQNRLFKIRTNLKYPEIEHPVLVSKEEKYENVMFTTIWHLAYCPNMWDIKKRYDCHMLKSEMHTPEFLRHWYKAHLFGRYPNKPIDILDVPDVILNEFNIDKDELYFQNRGIELKHFKDAIDWKNFFKCRTAIEFGCGLGPRVYAMNQIGISSIGIEKSKYAVDNKMCKEIQQGDILNYNEPVGNFDLSIAYDVLEHIDYKDLDKAINTIITFSDKYILVSIPYKGTPDCDGDPTHIIKEDREWWLKKFTDKGLKEVEVPEHFQFKQQLLIFEK